jgi:hypothetical protein
MMDGADVDDRRRVGPRPRQQFDGVQPDPDEQIGLFQDRRLDGAVRQDPSELRTRVRDHALSLVRDERRNIAVATELADDCDVFGQADLQADEDDRPPRRCDYGTELVPPGVADGAVVLICRAGPSVIRLRLVGRRPVEPKLHVHRAGR